MYQVRASNLAGVAVSGWTRGRTLPGGNIISIIISISIYGYAAASALDAWMLIQFRL